MTKLPSCIARMTCEDIAESVDGLPDELRSLMAQCGPIPIAGIWDGIVEPIRAEIARCALETEAYFADLAEAIGL